jgi:ribosomal protein S18 acetylase RimI-like enzyme
MKALFVHEPARACGKDCIEIRRVETARTLEDLEKMRESWREFQDTSTDIGEDIDFFKLVLTSRPEVLRPHVMLLLSNETPQAIMAGRLEVSELTIKLGYKSIWRQKARILAIPNGAFMGDVSKRSAVSLLKELLLVVKRSEADIIYFQSVALESPLYDAIKTTVPFYLRDFTVKPAPRWSMKLPPNINILYEKISGKRRYWFRRQFKVLERDFPGQICFKIFEKPQEVDKLCRDVEYITMKTYQRALGVGYIDNEENRTRLKLDAEKARLFANLLYIGKKPCAFWVGFIQHRTIYLYFTGFDPAYSKYELGTLLLLRMIEELIGRNINAIDFGFGDAFYKHRFDAESRDETSFYIFRPSLKWVSINFIRTIFGLSGSFAIYLLNRLGLTQKIKTGWRKRIRSKYQG